MRSSQHLLYYYPHRVCAHVALKLKFHVHFLNVFASIDFLPKLWDKNLMIRN